MSGCWGGGLARLAPILINQLYRTLGEIVFDLGYAVNTLLLEERTINWDDFLVRAGKATGMHVIGFARP